MKKIKGSTLIIVFMYATWVAYLFFQAACYSEFHVFLPSEVTILTGGLFIVETVSLLRLKLAKEGETLLHNKSANPLVERVGASLPDLEDEVQKQLDYNKAMKEGQHAKTDEP